MLMPTNRIPMSISDKDAQLVLAQATPPPVHSNVVPRYFVRHIR